MSKSDALRAAILSQNPTDQQKDAIFADQFEFLLRAAPGSGKTWTSCRRFIWRGANWQHRVGGLALLSFTNVAIREFKMATSSVGQGHLLSDPNYVGTFDSFVERYILSPFGHLLAGATKRPKLLLNPQPGHYADNALQIWVQMNGKKMPIRAWDVIPYLDDENKTLFTTQKGANLHTNSASDAIKSLLARGCYTHSQRIYWACRLLRDWPHIADVLARRFPEVIVDEAQDCNAWLLVLLNLLRDRGMKITLVGDPDQCIYEFSMADATSLPNLKSKWSIPEMPLSQSFRCNNVIAAAARSVGGNPAFMGCGDEESKWRNAFILRETTDSFTDAVSVFQSLVGHADVSLASSAIICRGRPQLASIQGQTNHTALKGKTKELATAAFLRDTRHDYHAAFQTVQGLLQGLTPDDPLWMAMDESPDSDESMSASIAIWRFVKSHDRLPSVSEVGNQWITNVREQIKSLMDEIGLVCNAKLGQHFKKTGLSDAQMALPLFEPQNALPQVRQDTIHQVKGESIDGVLVLGSPRFWNSVVQAVQNDDSSENRRLAYVAMTRARHLLLVALPQGHFDRHSSIWESWGFKIASARSLTKMEQ